MSAMRGMHSTSDIDAILRRLAQPSLGLVTAARASEAGIDRWALDRRRRSGALEPLFPGVFRLTSSAATPQQRVLGAALAVPGSHIAATSAAITYELPVRSGVDEPVVAVAASRSARTPGVVAIRQTLQLPSQPWHTVRRATPAACVLLLPRFVDPSTVERCLDHCLAHRLTTVPRVRELVERMPAPAVSGRRLLLELLAARTDGIGHRSDLEQTVARWLRSAGLSGWRRNLKVPMPDGDPIEVDFAWPDQQVVLEVSPFFTHGSREQQERDVERRRSLVLQGWRTVEATDPDIANEVAFRRCTSALRDLLSGRGRDRAA
jgi:very-short-patch-repair endonuclease